VKKLLVCLLAVLVPGWSWAGIVWKGDFETGNLSQYSSTQRVSADRLQLVQSPVHQGRYALKATVRQGDDPINASGNRNELVYQGREKEGSEYYYRWQVLFPQDYPSARTWQVFTQWHHSGCCGSPPVEFFVYGEEIRLTLTNSVTPWKVKLERGVWQDFIFHVKWSPDPAVGFVELWHNGQRVLSRYVHATMYPGDSIYLKLGLYRSDTIQPVGVVYHDGFVQATQLEDVLPSSPPQPEPTPDTVPSQGGEASPPVPPPSPSPGTPEPTSPEAEFSLHGCSSTAGASWVLAVLGLGGLLRRTRRR
jgi:MYXO-CTERM domain-containing protein